MKNVMVDLETMGNRPGSAIASIGAVFFDDSGLGPEFYTRVSLESCVTAGLTLDVSTVLWWMTQSQEARAELTTDVHKHAELRAALGVFTDWLLQESVEFCLWGNGSDFDNVLLSGAYERAGIAPPWRFWSNRCYRTLKALRPDIKIPRTGTHHNALDDAKSQALHAIQLVKALNVQHLLR